MAHKNLAMEVHHIFSPKNVKDGFSRKFNRIVKRYNLDLEGSWNKIKIPHCGRHPESYHTWAKERLMKIEKEFFALFSGTYSVKKFGVPESIEGYSHLDIPKQGYQENWKPLHFLKRKNEGPLADYVNTDICGRLCSVKLKSIIEKHLTDADNEIQWLPMIIEDEKTGEHIKYYYFHFPEICDTLDLEKSEIDEVLGIPNRTFLSYEKIKGRSIFNCIAGKVKVFISRDLKEAIFRSNCSGVAVEPAAVIRLIYENNHDNLK